MLIFSLALAAQTAAPQMTETHQRDIACVAFMGLIASDQRAKGASIERFPDVQERGRKWAGIVGDRVVSQSGLPAEVVGVAINEAVKAENWAIGGADEPISLEHERFTTCFPLMEADIAAASGVAPQSADWGTNDPAIIARYEAELAADLKDPARAIICRKFMRPVYEEVTKREGVDSQDSVALAKVMTGFERLSARLGLADPAKLAKYQGEIDNSESEWDGEALTERCLRLGNAAAALYPS